MCGGSVKATAGGLPITLEGESPMTCACLNGRMLLMDLILRDA